MILWVQNRTPSILYFVSLVENETVAIVFERTCCFSGMVLWWPCINVTFRKTLDKAPVAQRGNDGAARVAAVGHLVDVAIAFGFAWLLYLAIIMSSFIVLTGGFDWDVSQNVTYLNQGWQSSTGWQHKVQPRLQTGEVPGHLQSTVAVPLSKYKPPKC